MATIPNNLAIAPPPFTIDTLAERWACSANAIRNLIRAGDIRAFKIGALTRIPAPEVERIECLNTLSNASAAGTPSSISTETESGGARSLPRPIALARMQKRGSAGG